MGRNYQAVSTPHFRMEVSNETKLITQIFGLKSVMDKGLVNK
jgi:hypothetical protein